MCLLVQTPMRQIQYRCEGEFVARVNRELQKRGAPHKNMRVFAVSMTPPELLARDGLDIRDASCRINSNFLISSRTYWYVVPTFVFAKRDHGDLSRKESVIAFMKKFRITQEEHQRANGVLGAYVRRADYHAFTDPRRLGEYQQSGGTEREVMRCCVLKIVNKNGYEFAFIEITGDRFMYHQVYEPLRQMCVCACARACASCVLASVLAYVFAF